MRNQKLGVCRGCLKGGGCARAKKPHTGGFSVKLKRGDNVDTDCKKEEAVEERKPSRAARAVCGISGDLLVGEDQ